MNNRREERLRINAKTGIIEKKVNGVWQEDNWLKHSMEKATKEPKRETLESELLRKIEFLTEKVRKADLVVEAAEIMMNNAEQLMFDFERLEKKNDILEAKLEMVENAFDGADNLIRMAINDFDSLPITKINAKIKNKWLSISNDLARPDKDEYELKELIEDLGFYMSDEEKEKMIKDLTSC